jgi:phasin protein
MTNRSFDPDTVVAATREMFAPLLKAQHDSFKSLESMARLQYAVAGDVLESGLSRIHATFGSQTARELFEKHTELNSQLIERLRSRAAEFATVTSEMQAKFSQLGTEVAAKVVPARKAA